MADMYTEVGEIYRPLSRARLYFWGMGQGWDKMAQPPNIAQKERLFQRHLDSLSNLELLEFEDDFQEYWHEPSRKH